MCCGLTVAGACTKHQPCYWSQTPWYVGNYRIVSFKGNQVEIWKTEGADTTWVHLTDMKYILPVDNVITKLPDY